MSGLRRGERVLDWCSGRRVLKAFGALVAGGGAVFLVGPWMKLKSATDGRIFPEEEVTRPDALHRFLTEIGETGRVLYMESQFWDVANAVFIGTFAFVLTGWVARRSTEAPTRSLLLFIPLVVPLAEVIENGVLITSIAAFRDVSAVGAVLPVASGAKFAGLAGTFFFLIILGGRGLIARAFAGPKA